MSVLRVIPVDQYTRILELRESGTSLQKIADMYNVSTTSIFKIVTKLKKEAEAKKKEARAAKKLLKLEAASQETLVVPAEEQVQCIKECVSPLPEEIAQPPVVTEDYPRTRTESYVSKNKQKEQDFLDTLARFGIQEEILDILLPSGQALKQTEKEQFYKIVLLYLKDFENEELSSSDIDDILGLAICRILELRLLASSKQNDLDYTNVVNATEKIYKRVDKLKESLSARRSDRIDVKKRGSVSIVDLAAMFDAAEEKRFQSRVTELEERNTSAKEALLKHKNEDR